MPCRVYARVSTYFAVLGLVFLIYRAYDVDLWGDGVGPWLWFLLASVVSLVASGVAVRFIKD